MYDFYDINISTVILFSVQAFIFITFCFCFSAIKARYQGVEVLPNGAPKVVQIKVETVLKSSKVKIPVGDLTLWAETGCVCQQLKKGRYFSSL